MMVLIANIYDGHNVPHSKCWTRMLEYLNSQNKKGVCDTGNKLLNITHEAVN